MKRTSCLSLTVIALCATAASATALNSTALNTKSALLACQSEPLPLIPLEKSLWPQKSSSIAVPTASVHYSSTHAAANALIRGLLVANRTGEIGFSNVLSYRVQDVVRNLRRGRSIALAANRSSVPSPVVDRLLVLGNRNVN
jgi:hypothetical protein